MEIHQALNSDPVDIETLRRAAVSEGGLLTDDIRRKVWPKLLSINVYNLPAKPCECVFVRVERTIKASVVFTFFFFPLFKAKDVREDHKDYRQVVLDVKRSSRRFPKSQYLMYTISQRT